MKGLIDKYGQLHIERAGKIKIQQCRWKTISRGNLTFHMPCSDVCPMFGEPSTQGVDPDTHWTHINLCDGNGIVFEQNGFEDKREVAK